MERLTRLQGQTVGLDTAPIIYLIEQNETYLELVRAFFQAMHRGDFQVVTSTITLTEVFVHPLRSGNIELAHQYRDILLNQDNLIVIPVSTEIAENAAQLRATFQLRSPDAIQIATSIYAGATAFLTKDIRLPTIPNLEIVILNNLAVRDE